MFGQIGNNTFRGTFYEVGFRFYKSNQTSKKINMKQIYVGGYRLCNQVGRGKGIWTNIVIVTTRFLYDNILTRFGCPLTIIRDQGIRFINDTKTFNKLVSIKAC